MVKTQKSSLFGSCQVSYTVYDDAGNVVATICNYENSGAAPTTAEAAAELYDAGAPDDKKSDGGNSGGGMGGMGGMDF